MYTTFERTLRPTPGTGGIKPRAAGVAGRAWFVPAAVLTVMCLACGTNEGQAQVRAIPVAAQASEQEITLPSALPSGSRQVPITLYIPAGEIRGDVLVLPGGDHSRRRCLDETPLKAKADQYGFRLICPEMGRTLYESEYFPETRLRWTETPGLNWIVEILVVKMQERGYLLEGQNNYLLGLSTGARGVALIALTSPALFQAAAAFSGDYDQTEMTGEQINVAVYGPYVRFPERWRRVDNPQTLVPLWRTPIFLAHGHSDGVVPISQTLRFYEALKAAHPDLDLQLETPHAGHDYVFWGNMLDPAFAFLAAHRG